MEIQRGERFLKVYEFMISDLGLTGVQLLLFARIFGFSVPEVGVCFYEVAEDVAFTVDATGEILTVIMKDAATPGTPGKGYDKTGVDLAPIFALIAAGIAAAGGLVGYGVHKRRKSKKEEETEDGILDSEEI